MLPKGTGIIFLAIFSPPLSKTCNFRHQFYKNPEIEMRSVNIIILLFFFSANLISQPAVDSILRQLDKTLERKEDFFNRKYQSINQLKSTLVEVDPNNLDLLFNLNHNLFKEYGSFIYDSAFHYAARMQQLAFETGDPEKINISRMKMSFVLLSSGMFNEALDTLRRVDPTIMGNKQKVEYFDLMGRAFYDMAEYANDRYFEPLYKSRGNQSTRKAIRFADPGNYQHWASRALLHFKSNQLDSALYYYRKVLGDFDVSLHQKAMIYASMADCSLKTGDTLDAISYLANSAINDIKSVVTETIALRNLANVLYHLGYIRAAHRYIVLANNDASFYGARQRSFQISGVLPIIEGEKLELIEKQKKQLELYVIFLAILTGLIIFSLIVIFKQLTNLKRARAAILEANNNLKSLNETLKEANKIKEEYIAYYFNISTNYVDKLEYLKQTINRNLDNKRYSNISQTLGKLVIKKEREQLFRNFDKIFLSIFPDFVEGFNALFEKKDQVQLSEQGDMNTDLRIFALIRMGIYENEKIAKILNFSINTIYSYKNRIKKRSVVPNNEFEDRIMEIKSV